LPRPDPKGRLSRRRQQRVWVLVGTRPEVIKQAPVYIACRDALPSARVSLIGTGQHRELLDKALADFDLALDEDLGIMRDGQTPTSTGAAVLTGLEPLLAEDSPEWIVVQGDTTSAAMSAWAAFHAGVGVAHNEAGLRTYDLSQPFPEEANRKLISAVATEHFAPTEHARQALLAEGCPDERIHVTGNPGIDALRMTLAKSQPRRVTDLIADSEREGRQIVLMTAHRRENRGEGMDEWFATLREWLEEHLDLDLVYPMHPNRAGYAAAVEYLDRRPQVRLVEPFDYTETCHLLRHSRFTITDSGGIQEEGATLGVPVVVCRRVTERPEAVDAGAAYLASTDAAPLRLGLDWAYERSTTRDRQTFDPIFGDGHAGPRIASIIEERLG
jgi:UDP-N-acetylglucosamine 2-epimerase (non-hydrolysing)